MPIFLYKFLSFFIPYKIQYFLALNAGLKTADYICNNLPYVFRFNNRYDLLYYALSKVTIDEGVFCEFGIFSGRTINFCAGKYPQKTFYGFDSFKGLPENWWGKFHKNYFKRLKLPKVKKMFN